MWVLETLLICAAWIAGLWAAREVYAVLRKYWITRRMPGPPAYPLIGSFLAVAGPQKDLYDKLVALRAQHGPTVKFWLGPVLVVVVSRPEDLEVVFTDPRLQNKPDLMYSSSMEPVLGAGLITMNGAAYRHHRKVIKPSFAADVLQSFAPSFNANARRLVERLDGLADSGELFDAAPLSRMCTSYTVCETVLSADSTQLESDREAVVQAVYKGVTLMFHRGIRPWYRSDLLFYFSKHYDEYQDVVKVGRDFVSHVLDHKMNQMRAEGKPQAGKKNLAFLDHLLSTPEGNTLTKDELAGELKHLVAAANSTTSDTLSFFLYVLSLRPDVQDRVVEEMESVLGDPSEPLRPSDLVQLKYLERVLKETLRYFAPAPLYARRPTSDVTLPSGWVLPEGCVVVISPHFTHKDPEVWPEPQIFDPDRFLPENVQKRHRHSFIPFSAGARSCIGQRFVMMFLKTTAATVLRRFQFFPAPDGPQKVEEIRPLFSLTLHVQGGARVFVRRRHANR